MAMNAVGFQLNLAFRHLVRPFPDFIQQKRHLRQHFCERLTDQFLGFATKEVRRGSIGQIDQPVFIDANYPGGNTGQHGFHEAASFFQFIVGLFQFLALGQQLPGHPVKGPRQRRHFIIGPMFIDFCQQIPGTDPLRGFDKILNRPHQTGGNHQSKPHSSQHHHQ